jgi:hypothetical protein
MDARTPEEISEKILELCQQLAPASHAVLWTFLASHAGDSFLNVQQKVQRLRFRVLQLGNVSRNLPDHQGAAQRGSRSPRAGSRTLRKYFSWGTFQHLKCIQSAHHEST